MGSLVDTRMGRSYWTSSVQHRVLHSGARLGRSIGRETDTPGYEGVAKLVLDYTQESHCPN